MGETVVKVEGVSKKYCRTIKHTMLYGATDVAKSFLGLNHHSEHLRRGEFWAVDRVSFELKRGECLGLIGPNGSGKSSILKMLNGIFMPDKGRIEIKGRTGAIIEIGAGFHPMLTGRENIYINGAILGFKKVEIDRKFDEIVDFSELEEFIDSPVKHYSSGMKARLGFAVAAQMEPEVLLIDEVLAVGDIGFRIKCINRIKALSANTAVIFVTHSMPQVSNICSKILVCNSGKIIYYGNNVGEGIDCYIAQFANPTQNILGGAKAIISDVSISNGRQRTNGNNNLPVKYGDDLTIEMNLTLDASVKEPAMRVSFWNREQFPVAECFSPFSGFEFQPLQRSRIAVTLRNTQFNMGIYSLTIAVVDESNNETLCRYDNTTFVQAETACTSWAPIVLSGEWRQEL
jgi:homopolymeric O-antigen transport system ATP-binding protein